MVVALGVLILVFGGPSLPPEARIEAARAIERARYAFVLSATSPFDDAYPRQVFEKRVAREMKEERALAAAFGISITPEVLAQEYERIEKDTKAPDQWEAIKKALGNDRRLVEEAFCRPLVVDRELRARFAFDPKLHEESHTRAREARSRFVEGKPVEGARILRLSRHAEVAESTDALLDSAKAKARGPQVLTTEPQPKADPPVRLDPEARHVLEGQLKRPGDVSTILSERDRFSVYRVLAVTADAWTVEAAVFPKRDFEAWLAGLE